MSAYKRKNKWWVAFMIDGHRIRQCSPDNTKAGAIVFESQLRQKIANGSLTRANSKAKSMRYKDFVPMWLKDYVEVNSKPSDIVAKKMILRVHLLPYFGEMKIDQITNRIIEQFKAIQQRNKKSPKTINNHLGVLRKSLATADDWGLQVTIPKIKPLKVMLAEVSFLTVEECENVLQSADDIWHDMILLVMKTGLRFGELVALNWQDIDFANKQITVCRSIVKNIPQNSTKSNKIRHVPFGNEVEQMLILRKSASINEYVFSNKHGEFMKSATCRTNLIRICKQVGVTKIGWHLLRHTFASHLSENNISPIIIQKLLGHSDIKTTMRYAHLGNEVTREAVKTLERPIILEGCHNFATKVDNDTKTDKIIERFTANIKQEQE
ncbi:site-specific integrase [Candidatus Parcubacteria bacterium]|nr:site-specific integrase [Patescibacteria group bacterium]MBU4309800.1 site-specific integrase [Patescibacteria group bacterium]MBU4431931.1 site-specific integrase [Patescibacteria group bacterium]MBU4578139.1 site-specific integrase [Patescibacteria group bacterium]MCG2696676.1 site-specific integrase [Candidatus Parcubacteria bacterium]